MKPKAVVLLSGGLDSATAFAVAKSRGFECMLSRSITASATASNWSGLRAVASALGAAEHRTVRLDLRADRRIGPDRPIIAVPKDRDPDEMGHGIPVTYVPARNTILLGLALGYAETVGAFDIFIGANVLDYSGYPDCRPEFLAAFETLANLATKAGVEGAGRFRVHSPLLKMTKAEIIREGAKLGVDYALTLSCYDPDAEGRACGRCDSCQLRKKGFAEAGVPDPTRYQESTTESDTLPPIRPRGA